METKTDEPVAPYAATAPKAPAGEAVHPASVRQACAARLTEENAAASPAHESKSSSFFYLLSFAPPLPSPFRSFRGFITHPYILYAIGLGGAIAGGFASFPVLDLVYGLYWSNRITGAATSSEIQAASNFAGIILLCTAAATLIFTWIFQSCFTLASSDLTKRMRLAYVASVLAQDASYFDTHGAGEVASHAGKEINLIRTGFGEKLGFALWTSTIVVCSLIIGFCVAARVTGFLFTVVPLVVVMFALLSKASEAIGAPALRLEGRASSYVEEIVGSMRIVQSFNMAAQLLRKYDKDMLSKLEMFGRRKALIRGTEAGAVYFALFVTYSAAFWFIGFQLVRGNVDLGNGLTAFWNLINALFAFASAVPHIASIVEALSAVRLLRAAIERKPKIDIRNKGGQTLPDTEVHPEFELEDVTLAYPSRPSMPSLRNVNLKMMEGKVTAIVGPSGSGKSTITSLLLREYDPETANVPLESDEAENAKADKEDRRIEAKQAKVTEKESRDEKKGPDGKRDRFSFLSLRKKPTSDSSASQMERASSADSGTRDSSPEKRPEKSVRAEPRVQGGGRVLYSGVDVRQLNLRWLRSQVAIVRQNPQIFTATVFENVAAGLSGTEWAYQPERDGAEDGSPDVKERTAVIRERVRVALRKAQAIDFVEKLPEGMDTPINGGKTGLLSGGQRQRLSLARALVRQPRVLVIDEGTSAIDTNTEDKIRIMLAEEHAQRGMTTILIAHRLSTVEHADTIVVMRSGKIVDQGNHSELMEAKRPDQTYRNMVKFQRAIAEVEHDEANSDAVSISSSSPADGKGVGESEEDANKGALTDAKDAAPASSATMTRPSIAAQRAFSSEEQTTNAASSTIVPLRSEFGGDRQERGNPSMSRRRSSRASEHHHGWSISGRTLPIHQIEHAAESAANKVEMHKVQRYHSHTAQSQMEDNATNGRLSVDSTSTAPSPEAALDVELPSRRLWRNFRATFNEHKLDFTLGIVGAIAAGAVFPAVGWITGNAVDALNEPTPERITSRTHLWALVFLCISVADLALILMQSYYLEMASERMSRSLKYEALSALMRQEIGFFDREEAQSGALAANVSSYPAAVAAATGLVAAQIIIALTNLLGSAILAFVLNWKAAFVTLSPVVVLFFSGWLNVAMLERYERSLHEPASKAASFIAENVDAIKEVSALGRERETLRIFDERARANTPRQLTYLLLGGGGFSISQAAVFGTSALIFYYGGTLLAEGNLSITSVYAIFEAAVISVFAGGRIFTFTGDIGRAAAAFRALCGWYERRPRVASLAPRDGSRSGAATPARSPDAPADLSWTTHDIIFHDVELRYPRRPNHPAIRDLNLTIHAGQHQAFCGTSGSGKSTILQMVQRFYDPYRGTITVGPTDIRAIDMDDLRSAMSYVSQDACLYEGTIRFNLLLGAAKNQQVSDEELEACCEDACIADFVRGLPQGYDTDIGSKGTQLSGGQRQRICIARALIKKPQILLLDEATSALDAQAEVSVQKALDNASRGRTTLTVAHRLSTIRGADVIHVVEDGAIVESGSHAELVARRGRYLELIQAQL